MKASIELDSGRQLLTEVQLAHAVCAETLLQRLRSAAMTLQPDESREIELDWALVELQAVATHVELREPDYRNDASRFVDSLDFTCTLFEAQRQLLEKLNLQGQERPVSAGQYVRVARAALDAASVIGVRIEESEVPFSGWQIASIADPQQEAAGLYTVRELAALRPAWIVGLALPANWAFRYVGHTLLECVSPSGEALAVFISIDM